MVYGISVVIGNECPSTQALAILAKPSISVVASKNKTFGIKIPLFRKTYVVADEAIGRKNPKL
ncbi:MAG: hypothetical protein V4596_14540 [Bdellovibrionota bacterium]